MTSEDAALFAAVRQRRRFTHRPFDDDTEFVDVVLKWLRDERADGRLANGPPVTLILFDFTQAMAAALGPDVALLNGGAVQGAFHLCAPSLRRAAIEVGATNLAAMAAHQDMLVKKQLANHTSVTFNPANNMVQIRLACLPAQGPFDLRLADQIAQGWTGQGLTPLGPAISSFHAGLHRDVGIGSLFFDDHGLRTNVRSFYRKAMYLYLTYQLGLSESNGYRVVASERDVRVSDVGTATAALVTVAGSRSTDPQVAAAAAARLLAAAQKGNAAAAMPLHISCIACPADHPPDIECAVAPVSLRHRHIEPA
jgi:hypothetical protein